MSGPGAVGRLRHEVGVHRVQRVPATETQGRVHTSTASVAVLPSALGVEAAPHNAATAATVRRDDALAP